MIGVRFRAWFKPQNRMYARAYQKLLYILLCEDDGKGGEGKPALRAGFDDCMLLQSTTLVDKNGREIFEGDLVRIRFGGRIIEGAVGDVPDMFKSRKIHPLRPLLERSGLETLPEEAEIEVIGNSFETACQ